MKGKQRASNAAVRRSGGGFKGVDGCRAVKVQIRNTLLRALARTNENRMNWLKQLQQKWDDWCGDREMETSIRTHLSRNGYFGKTAKFRAVRLVAVQRPGWLQIYRFEAEARVDPDGGKSIASEPASAESETTADRKYHQLFGLVREDHRQNVSNVRVFESESQRKELFDRWSEGLVCLRGAKGLVSS